MTTSAHERPVAMLAIDLHDARVILSALGLVRLLTDDAIPDEEAARAANIITEDLRGMPPERSAQLARRVIRLVANAFPQGADAVLLAIEERITAGRPVGDLFETIQRDIGSRG
jgi:hypothetical protein